MSRVQSTKPSQRGTFGEERKTCVYDGSTMRKLDYSIPRDVAGVETFMCPVCGWLANFVKKEG